MSRNRAYLPPKSTTNSSFMIDWEIVNRKKQIETLRPREIQVRKNHSFHAGSSDCNKSIFEKSFEDIYENQKNSQKFQKEFNQLKSLINSKQQQIEQSEKKRLSEHQNEIPKPLMQEIGNYHTFKPVFERLSSLIDVPKQNNQENIKIQTRLSTIFDSLEMESTRTSKDPQKVDSILQLVENLLKDCVIPILSQQKSSLSSQKSQPQIFTLQSSQQLNTNTITLRSMSSIFQDLIDLFKCTKESGYLIYQVQPKPVLIESVTQFNISKYQSCKLFDMYFEKEIQLDIAHKSFKQCVSTESCQIINQVLLIPIQYNNQRIIYVMNGFQDNIDYGFIQQNLQMQILRKSNSFIRLVSSINKCFQQRANLYKLQAVNQFKFRVRRSNQITINLYHFFLKIGMKRIKQFQNKPDQKQQQNDRLFYILRNYNTKLQNQAFRAIQGNEDQLIMIQALQTENSVESYLRKVSMIIGEKIVLSILNEEIQIMTSYIPDVGLYQEYIDNVDDLSSYKSLNSITKPFNTELQNIGYEFTQRHIWQVTEDIYLITFSNMQSQYLSKLALVITNAMQFMRQKYLNVFSIVRNINQQSYKRVLTKYFERWRTQQQEQIMNYEEDLQNLKLQNTIRTKYLSTALIQNIINRKQQTQKLQMVYMNEWRNQTKNEKNIQMRIRGGIYLMKRYIQSISKHNMIIAFREIAFSNFVNQSSPIVKNNTKRSIFTQREQSKRSQEELEQSVLWDVHQMRLNTPLHDQSYRTNKNPSPVTMNNSIQLTEYEINQYHSQRANQKQVNINIVRKNSRNKSNNSIDQENLPPPVGENRIYSKKTKDFVKKIQQTGHQRFNSTSPNMNVNKYNNTAFSFDENSEF